MPLRRRHGGFQACLLGEPLAGERGQLRSDPHREDSEPLVSRQLLQALLCQLARGADVASQFGEPGPDERELRPAQRGMASEEVQAVLGLGSGKPLQQQRVPLREVAGPASSDMVPVG